MNHLDLFTGISGFTIAAKRVWGKSHKCAGFCEINPFCTKLLNLRFPGVKVYDDIKKLKGGEFEKIDLLTGGFPCQPSSHAGKRKGTSDARWLWPEMYRVICEAKPRWVIAENVTGIISIEGGVPFENVCTDLERADYIVQPFVIPACSKDAPHKRERVWFVARYSKYSRLDGTKDSKGVNKRDNHNSSGKNKLIKSSRPNTLWDQDAQDSTSNSNHPGVGASSIGTYRDWEAEDGKEFSQFKSGGHSSSNVTNADSTRLQRINNSKKSSGKSEESVGLRDRDEDGWEREWPEVAAELCRVDDGLSSKLDGPERTKRKNRSERIKALGNAIVPAVVEEIMRAIKETDNT